MNDDGTESFGLLKGVDTSVRDCYSDDMSPSPQLSQRGLFWEMAEKDATGLNCTADGYMIQLDEKLSQLMSGGDVFDRTKLKEEIRHLAKANGGLTFITGSRSIGKTRLLKEVAEEYKDPSSEVMLVYVDGRDGSLARGIRKALEELKDKKWYQKVDFMKVAALASAGKTAIKPLSAAHPTADAAIEAASCGLNEVFARLAGSDSEEADLVELIADLAVEQQKKPCLVIDEANRIATAEDTAVMAKIVSNTKAKYRMSIMLCTSIHSYPRKMDEQFQLDFAQVRYVEEFSPSTMWDILTEQQDLQGNKVVGMGPHLARVCISSFGGNLLRTTKAINSLALEREEFTPVNNVLLHLEGYQAIEELLNNAKAKPVLIALAKKGYWKSTIETFNIARDLVERGVASELAQGHLVIGSPLRGLPSKVLVPSSQALRCYIIETYPEGFKSN